MRAALARVPTFMHVQSKLLQRDRFTLIRVDSGALAGAQLEIDPDSERDYWSGTYELETQRVLAELPIEGRTVWDVGAHIGFFALLFERMGARVVAVEPDPENAERLRENVRLNRVSVEVVEEAVGREVGSTRIVRGGRMTRVAADDAAGTTVREVTLDDLGRRYGYPDLIKLDVEGAELEALAGAPEVLERMPTLFIEAHSSAITDELRSVLETRGYVVEETGHNAQRLLALPSATSPVRPPETR